MNQQSIIPLGPDKLSLLSVAQELHDFYRQHGLIKATITRFQEIIIDHFTSFGRTFTWRQDITPYRVVVSEIMLQQTQTFRVATKFDPFIKRFDSFQTLAQAPFDEVLRYWKGLGYNRRAVNLQKIAHVVANQFNGILPDDPSILESFPGIGKATASSICAFAFNQPTTFIETNIRTVFIFFFFPFHHEVHDKEIMPFIKATVPLANARNWYYALMDYGVVLKKLIGNLSQRSTHYSKQSKFEGSARQIRGKILQLLLDKPYLQEEAIITLVNDTKNRTLQILLQLEQEGFIARRNNTYYLKQ